jgi:plasmid stability protein
MAQLLIRNLDDSIKNGILLMAKRHGRSMEEEGRVILGEKVLQEDHAEYGLGDRIAARFADLKLTRKEKATIARGIEIAKTMPNVPFSFDDPYS